MQPARRAARCDLNVETGVDFTRVFQFWVPDDPQPFASTVEGQRVYFEGLPQKVYSVTTMMQTDGMEYTTIKFGRGLWYEPSVRALATDLLQPAKLVTITTAEAATTVNAELYPPDGRLSLPVIVDSDSVILDLDEGFTADLGGLVDYGPFAWDLYVTTDEFGWIRLVQGTLSVLRGETRNELYN